MMKSVPSRLSDVELVAEVKRLVRCEREATVQLIVHLAELDVRRLYLAAGFSSLFAYRTAVLHLSEHEAYNRIEAARTARKFPAILEMLSDSLLTLTTVRLLAPHLTSDNHRRLLEAASGRSKREVEELLAGYYPRPAVPSSVRKLPAPKPASAPVPSGALSLESTTVVTPPAPAASSTRPAVAPLAPGRYQIRFTASAKTCEKLRLAQDLLRHVVPNGDTAEIFDRALTALIDELVRKKFAATARPRSGRHVNADSRYIPARVKRAVWVRDGGRCAFVARSGRRCTERGFVEFHHVHPYGAGGEATVENIALRCRAHNSYEAGLYYGASRSGRGEDVVSESTACYWAVGRRLLVPDRVSIRSLPPAAAGRTRPRAVPGDGGPRPGPG